MVSIGHIIWGVLLVLAGVSLVAENVFSLAWPIIRVLIAGLLIFKGLYMIIGQEHKKQCRP